MKSIFKNTIIAAALLFGAANVSNAQVKVGASPSTIGTNSNLEVEAANGSKTVVTKDSSKVGVGTDSPTNKLHVVGTANPVRFEGIQSTVGTGLETPLVIDANGVLKKQSSSTPYPTVRASAGIATNYNIGSGTGIKVPLNQLFSTDGNFSVATNLYTVPTNGVYQIAGALGYTGTTSTSTVSISLFAQVNGADILLNNVYGTGYAAGGSFSGVLSGSVTVPLNAGTTIGLRTITCSGCGSQTYTGTAQYTNMTITKMN